MIDEDGVVVRGARNGDGLFASRRYARGQRIIDVRGRIYNHRVLWRRGGTFADNCYRFGPETYLDPGDGVARYVNHSCAPNAAVGKERNRLYLFAVEPIARGAEILFDYSTILGDDDIWTMRCNCGHTHCRKRIKRFGSLPRALQERYVTDGLVPRFIINTLL